MQKKVKKKDPKEPKEARAHKYREIVEKASDAAAQILAQAGIEYRIDVIWARGSVGGRALDYSMPTERRRLAWILKRLKTGQLTADETMIAPRRGGLNG